jgi:protein-L-isoaspartate(D-aspartate) O-methyltransferase
LTIINGCIGIRESMDNFAARLQMVDQQIRTWEVLDPRVLDVIAGVPRELFVPEPYRELAFADAPIPIGHGERMLTPKLQARILQALAIAGSDRVLEVGTGTGYLAACMSLLAAETASIDIHPDFTAQAALNIRKVDGARVHTMVHDAFGPPLGEYDAIAVTGSLPIYDSRFERALRVGGRLFAVVGAAPVMEAMLVRRVGPSEWIRESLFETVVDALAGAPAAPGFVF